MTARKGNSNLLDDVKIKEIAMMEMLRSKTGQGLSRANSRAPSPHAHVHANAALSSTLTADEGQSQATLPATEPNASNLAPISDPSVQSMFDQFWVNLHLICTEAVRLVHIGVITEKSVGIILVRSLRTLEVMREIGNFPLTRQRHSILRLREGTLYINDLTTYLPTCMHLYNSFNY